MRTLGEHRLDASAQQHKNGLAGKACSITKKLPSFQSPST